MWSVKTLPKVRFSKSTLLIFEFEAEIISISFKVVTSILKKVVLIMRKKLIFDK
jgi:hypothetical protein